LRLVGGRPQQNRIKTEARGEFASDAVEFKRAKLRCRVLKYEGWNFNSGNYLFTTDTKYT